MPCVEETEKGTEMPRGWLPPHPWLLRAFYFLGRTSKAASLAISSPSFALRLGGLNYSRLQRLNKAVARSPGEGQPSRDALGAALPPNSPLLPPPSTPCLPKGLRRVLANGQPEAELSRAAPPARSEKDLRPHLRGVMGVGSEHGRGSAGSAGSPAFLRGLSRSKGS